MNHASAPVRNTLSRLILVSAAFAFSGYSFLASPAPNERPVKNVIVMIADGCGFNQVEAADLYQYGETGRQVYESFPVKLAMSTFEAGGSYDPGSAWTNFDYVLHGFTDSAAAATAMSTGHKSYNAAIGVDVDKKPLVHALQCAKSMGKAAGVATSVELSHATPAGFVAHNEARDSFAAIANEMIFDRSIDLIMGCGHPLYTNDGVPGYTLDANKDGTPEAYDYKWVGGEAAWEALTQGTAVGADANGDEVKDPWTLVQSRAEFQSLMIGPAPKRVIGVPQVFTTLQQARAGDKNAAPFVVPLTETVPTLAEMSRGALNVLDGDPDGLFLMIEGGAVDWAGHSNQSGRLIEEKIGFNEAVEAVVAWIEANSSWDETLLVITGDHETGYLTGPDSGQTPEGPVWNPLKNNGAGQLPGMEWHAKGHTNSLIPFYAKGACSGILQDAAQGTDPRRGPYLDNTGLGKTLITALGGDAESLISASF